MTSIVVEAEGKTETLSLFQLEKLFSFIYRPHLEFASPRYCTSMARKVKYYYQKGMLDVEQVWLGIYFRRELRLAPFPPVRLCWINTQIGWGLFADCDLKELQFIGEYAGIVRKRKRSDRKNAYCFEYPVARGESTKLIIDAEQQGGITRFINHSSQPNLSIGLAVVDALPHIIFYTKRPVLRGEQLCYDYGPNYWEKRAPPV
jgi:uncharacterized protein